MLTTDGIAYETCARCRKHFGGRLWTRDDDKTYCTPCAVRLDDAEARAAERYAEEIASNPPYVDSWDLPPEFDVVGGL